MEYTTKKIQGFNYIFVKNNNVCVGIERIRNQKPVPDSTWTRTDEGFATILKEFEEYLCGERQTFTFPIAFHGTHFQEDVWNALRDIPYGEIRTYSDIAAAIGRPKSVRAVGNAIGSNPLLIVVPCHRVIGKDGGLHGFGSGLDLKVVLLDLEKKHAQKNLEH